jgi:hypothetical protein
MHDALMIYFNGEKNAGLFLAGAGAAIIGAAALLFRARSDLRSFAVTLGVLAVAEIAIGVGLYLRTGPQVSRLVAELGSDAARFSSVEGARMVRVQRNFVVIEYVEVAIIIVSAVAALVWKDRPTASGVALGLVISGALLLAFDIIAERRGALYVQELQTIRPLSGPPRL